MRTRTATIENLTKFGRVATLFAALLIFAVSCGKAKDSKAEPPAPKKGGQAAQSQPPSAPKEEVVEESGSFDRIKVKSTDKGSEKPVVEVDMENLVIVAQGNVSAESEAGENKASDERPSGCLANMVRDTSRNVFWRPKLNPKGIGGANIACVQASPDKSVLLVVETTGIEGGPRGSRVLLFDTYEWRANNTRHLRALRLVEFNDKRIVDAKFLPGSANIVFWAERQASLKEPSSLFTLDCSTGATRDVSKFLKGAAKGMTIDRKGSVVALIDCDDSEIVIFNMERLSEPSATVRKGDDGANPTCMAITRADSAPTLVVGYDNGAVRAYSLAGELKAEFKVSDPVEEIVSIDGTTDMAVTTSREVSMVLNTQNGTSMALGEGGSTGVVFSPETSSLVSLMKLKNAVSVCEYPSLSKKAEFSPGSLRPSTEGDIRMFEYLPHWKRYLVADSFGNLYFVIPSKNMSRWGKSVLTSSLELKK